MSTKSSSKVTTYKTSSSSASPGKGGYSSSRIVRPVTQSKGRYSFGGGRMSMGGGMGGGMITRSTNYSLSAGLPSSGFGAVSNQEVSQLLTSRTGEKKDMQDLNERFASYIEKVRFLEAQNKKLATELKELKEKWGEPSKKIKDLYEAELKQVKDLYDESEKEKEKYIVQLNRLQENLEEANDRIDQLEALLAQERDDSKRKDTLISDYVAELELLRSRVDSLENQAKLDKNDIERLNAELLKCRCDLDNEMLCRVEAENRTQSVQEDFDFARALWEQEAKDLAALACRDTTTENKEYWDQQLRGCLVDLNDEYKRKMDSMQMNLEANYNMKLQEFKTGNLKSGGDIDRLTAINNQLQSRLNDNGLRMAEIEAELAKFKKMYTDQCELYENAARDWDADKENLNDQIRKLREELSNCMAEINRICDAKMSLELEIAAYKSLLCGEESRILESQNNTSQSLNAKPDMKLFANMVGGGGNSSFSSPSGGGGGGSGGGSGGGASSGASNGASSGGVSKSGSSSGGKGTGDGAAKGGFGFGMQMPKLDGGAGGRTVSTGDSSRTVDVDVDVVEIGPPQPVTRVVRRARPGEVMVNPNETPRAGNTNATNITLTK